jgi:sugar O-acyltransferase (sialic acid O-acetyltransferase NeuD family)
MKSQEIFVYGAGGHGKVVADILISKEEKRFAGFVDDRDGLIGTKVIGYPILGNGDWLHKQAIKRSVAIVLGVGDNCSRRLLAERCVEWEVEILSAIHRSAAVAPSAELGPGTVVMGGAVINSEAKLGRGVIVNSGAIVEHDVEIGDYAHVSPNASLGGASRLGSVSHLGLGAVVLPGVSVGSESVIGAGAVVLKDLPSKVVAVGVPARILRSASHL